MRSLRNRLIAATLTATLLILLAAAVLIYAVIRVALLAEFDQTLLSKAKAIAALAEEDEGRFELDFEVVQMPEFESGSGCEYFQIWNDDGDTLARSTSIAGDSLYPSEAGAEPGYRYIELRDGRPGRQVTLGVPIRRDRGDEPEEEGLSRAVVTIAVARDTLDLNQTLRRLALILGSVTLGAVLLSAVVQILVVRFTLKPVGQMAAQIAAINASNVSCNGKLTCSIEELDPVVNRLNELLERLNMAFAREKAFTADVAHELRTPLAGLSAALEVCSSRPRDEAAYREVILKCLGTTHTMQSMVENLLTLARADAGQLTLQKKPLNLKRFTRDCWHPFETDAAKRELRVNWPNDDETIDVVTDRELLRIVLSNLLDNTVRHADHGGTVAIEIIRDSNNALLEIRNTGCNLSPADTEKVFERFWKHDAARTEGAEHCGIGLSLCRRIVETLGGSISAAIANSWFAVKIRLPLGTNGEV